MKNSIKSVLLASALLAGTAAAVGLMPHTQSQNAIKTSVVVPPMAKPRIEVVFVLDTTSSMSGLIDAAKNNIWSIATSMASAQPGPDMQIGLVAFRDRGDDYVTRVLDLSRDLDSMYASLMDFRAEGGGDGPESVNAALNVAVNNIGWSQDSNSYKVIFLVGDAPPHMDYQGEIQYPEILKQAAEKGIVVNCIQAGNQHDTRKAWQQIASLNQGQYFQVEQSGSAVAVATPFDEKLAQLAGELDDTRLFYGDSDTRKAMASKVAAADKVRAAAPAAVQAKRAEFNASSAGAGNLLAESELVDAVSNGRVKLDTLEKSQLPVAMRDLQVEEQKVVIKQKAEKRKAIKEEIARLGAERQRYINDNVSAEKLDASLDGKLYSTIKEQAQAKGLIYDRGPSL